MPENEPFDREIKRGTLELLLLRLVREKRSYGYELVTDLHERSGGWIDLKEGTLYPTLHKLESAGLIAARWSDPSAGRARKYYAITAKGARELAGRAEQWREFSTAVNAILLGV